MDQPTQTSCPYCLSHEGYVRGVMVNKNDQQTLTYRCDSCKRSWDGEPYLAQPLPLLNPAEDLGQKQ